MRCPLLLSLSTAAVLLGCDPPSTSVAPDPAPADSPSSDGDDASATAPAKASSAPADGGPGTANRNALFLNLFRSQLPADLCKPEQYFRVCFRVSEERCKAVVSEELDQCVARHRTSLPLVLDGASGAKAGQTLGQCAGAAYDIRLIAERIQSAKCNDPTQWTGK